MRLRGVSFASMIAGRGQRLVDRGQAGGAEGGLSCRQAAVDGEVAIKLKGRQAQGDIADCPLFLTGSAAEIQDTLQRRRERTGLSHIVIQHRDLATTRQFAEAIITPLAGK